MGNITLNGDVISSSGFSQGWPGSNYNNMPLSVAVSVLAGTNTLQIFNAYNAAYLAGSLNPAGLVFSVANVSTGVTYAVSSAVAGPTQSATTDCAAGSAFPTLPGTYTATDGSCAVVACPSPPPCSVFVAAGVCSVIAPAVPCPPPSPPAPPSPPPPSPPPPLPPFNVHVVCSKVTNRWPLNSGYASGSTVIDTVGSWNGTAYGDYSYIAGADAPVGAIAFDGVSGYVQVGAQAGAFGGASAFCCATSLSFSHSLSHSWLTHALAVSWSFWGNVYVVTFQGRFFDWGNGPSSDNLLFTPSYSTTSMSISIYDGLSIHVDRVTGATPSVNTWNHFAVTVDASGAYSRPDGDAGACCSFEHPP